MDCGLSPYLTMRHRTFIILIALALTILPRPAEAQDPFNTVKPIDLGFRPFGVGDIRPLGWLKQQMKENLEGFTGHLDSIAPDLVLADDIYGRNRISKNTPPKKLGAISDAGEIQAQFLWWNSETQSNWWDGFIRTAILSGDCSKISKVKRYVDRILATQDADGYLGIYEKDMRYRFSGENGELWSKATLYRALLAWYEFTRDQKVLDAVRKATDDVMRNYPMDASHPFMSGDPFAGGLTHGLCFTDVLDWLHRIDPDPRYPAYIIFLYKDFSEHNLADDAQLSKAMDTAYQLKGHGVHTYEHLRALTLAYKFTGSEALSRAFTRYLAKIRRNTTVSGAPIGDEFIGGRYADASNTGYEYCSIHELMDGYGLILRSTADAAQARAVEWMFFNAAQGARHPDGRSICYLKTDNCHELSGGRNGDKSDKTQTRYRYSPIHREAAVCCVPNAGRIAPTFVQNMWLRKGDELFAVLYGPAELNTTIGGKPVRIRQLADYPFVDSLLFEISTDQPMDVTIHFRQPLGYFHEADASALSESPEQGFIKFTGRVNGRKVIRLRIKQRLGYGYDNNIHHYFSWGPVLYCMPIAAEKIVTSTFQPSGLQELHYIPVKRMNYSYDVRDGVLKKKDKAEMEVDMTNTSTGKKEKVVLVPFAGTILRQVTFAPTENN